MLSSQDEVSVSSEPPRELKEDGEELLEDKFRELRGKSSRANSKKDKSSERTTSSSSTRTSSSTTSNAENGSLAKSRQGSGNNNGTPGHRHTADIFWERTERYCTKYPDNCSAGFCNWYPDKCEEFCERFEQWCLPPEVSAQC